MNTPLPNHEPDTPASPVVEDDVVAQPTDTVAQALPSEVGPYRILRRLGSGTLGEVYLARDPAQDRDVALRVFDPAALMDQEPAAARSAFLNAASSVQALRHPHIAPVYDMGEHDGVAWMTMESVYNGRTLKRFCESGGSQLPLDDVVRIIRSVSDALNHAHGEGVVHLGVRPSNILLGVGAEPKLTDFALTGLLPNLKARPDGPFYTADRYMSPEQLLGRAQNRFSDIFSLGLVLYEMLSMRHPFDAKNIAEQFHKTIRERHVPVRKYRSDTPRVLEMISNRCLAKRPTNRYETAMHLSANLDVARDVLASSSSGVAKAQIFMRVRQLEQFAEFSEQELRETVLNATYCTFKPGDEIIAKGDRASNLYVVIDGEVGVQLDALDFIHLGPGECVGEIAAITGQPRTSTVVALDRCGLLSIPSSFLDNGPVMCQLRLKNMILRTLAERFATSKVPFC